LIITNFVFRPTLKVTGRRFHACRRSWACVFSRKVKDISFHITALKSRSEKRYFLNAKKNRLTSSDLPHRVVSSGALWRYDSTGDGVETITAHGPTNSVVILVVRHLPAARAKLESDVELSLSQLCRLHFRLKMFVAACDAKHASAQPSERTKTGTVETCTGGLLSNKCKLSQEPYAVFV